MVPQLRSSYPPSDLFLAFRRMLSTSMLRALIQATPCRFYWRTFSPLVLLWGFVHQFTSSDHSCDGVLGFISSGELDEWEAEESVAWRGRAPSKPLSERVTQQNAAYCQGRKRLPLSWLQHCVRLTSRRIREEAVNHWDWMGRSVFLLDGTTFLTQSTPELAKHYGRHANQSGEGHWPVARCVASFDMHTGAAVAMVDGTLHCSEQILAAQLFQQLAPFANWLEPEPDSQPHSEPHSDQEEADEVMAGEEAPIFVCDRNFGVYLVAQAATAADQDIVVRMTESRAKAVFKRAHPRPRGKNTNPAGGTPWESLQDVELDWYPSRSDQVLDASDPGFTHPIPTAVRGRLIRWTLERPGFRPQELYLFTTLLDRKRYSAKSIVELYGYRWRAELDFRELKDSLGLTHLRAKTVDMVRKELYAGLLAYNLIRSIMLLTAVHAPCEPRDLSFQRCWRRIQAMMAGYPAYNPRKPQEMEKKLARLLYMLAGCQIYRRKKARSEPRVVRRHPCPYPRINGDRMEYLAMQNAKS